MKESDERYKQLKIENQTRDQNKEQINREVSQRVLAKHGLLDHPKAADICETVLVMIGCGSNSFYDTHEYRLDWGVGKLATLIK